MSYEVSEWLAQIKTLQQELVEAERDRDAAHESATNWRQRYTIEAQQRRTEAQQAQEQIERLKAQIQQLQSFTQSQPDDVNAIAAVEAEVEQLDSIEELKTKLQQVLLERDRLLQALKTEQANHAQTRKSLTNVIADTIDKINKNRGTT